MSGPYGSMRSTCIHYCSTRTSILPRPPQNFEVTFSPATLHIFSFQGYRFSLVHCRTSRCLFAAAAQYVSSSQGHLFSLAHCRTSSSSFTAASCTPVLLPRTSVVDRLLIPRASIVPRPLQNIEVPATSCSPAPLSFAHCRTSSVRHKLQHSTGSHSKRTCCLSATLGLRCVHSKLPYSKFPLGRPQNLILHPMKV